MTLVELIARAKVRPGQVQGFKDQAAEIMRLTREKDTHTLRCDWFINEAGTEAEVHETYPDEQGLVEHRMHTIEAADRLFRDHAFDHRATLYGEVSAGFLDLVEQRMGAAPAVFSFVQGLERAPTVWPPPNDPRPSTQMGGVMGHLELHANLKIRPGQLEGFKAQAAEIMRLTREKDTHTLRYDWFINEDGTECEVHEAYQSGDGLVEHNMHVLEARNRLFEEYAYDHRMTAFGELSDELRALADKHAGGITVYSFFQGLDEVAAV